MAYNPKNLSVLAYANGHTSLHYVTSDTFSTVTARGYFSGASDRLRKGDKIDCNLGDYTDFATLWVCRASTNFVEVDEVGASRVSRYAQAES